MLLLSQFLVYFFLCFFFVFIYIYFFCLHRESNVLFTRYTLHFFLSFLPEEKNTFVWIHRHSVRPSVRPSGRRSSFFFSWLCNRVFIVIFKRTLVPPESRRKHLPRDTLHPSLRETARRRNYRLLYTHERGLLRRDSKISGNGERDIFWTELRQLAYARLINCWWSSHAGLESRMFFNYVVSNELQRVAIFFSGFSGQRCNVRRPNFVTVPSSRRCTDINRLLKYIFVSVVKWLFNYRFLWRIAFVEENDNEIDTSPQPPVIKSIKGLLLHFRD